MSDTLRLLLALLELGPRLRDLLGDKWPPYGEELLELASRASRGEDPDKLRQALDLLVVRLLAEPPAIELVERVMADMAAPAAARETVTRRGRVTPTVPDIVQPSTDEATGVVTIPVFYGTDRARGDDTPANYFRGERGALSFGVAEVSVPTRGRDLGELTSPSWWRLEFSANPEKHVILKSVGALGRDVFVTSLKDSLAAADVHDALIFVHGYNVTFVDAARRAAQLAVDLKFAGRTLLYSWASAADTKKYTVDESTIDWSRDHFEAFLQLALGEIGAGKVHIIAHSMGNRAVINTLERVTSWQLPAVAAKLGQIIFAAPDIDRDRFIQLAAKFKGCAARVTLYASSRDVALLASKFVHGYPRAGEAGDALTIVDGVDTIDASLVDTSLVGLHHSYFGEKRSILNDMFNLIAQQLAPDQRFDLQAAGDALRKYWSYRA
ncbi:alpha/beta hydrolase [Bradyrhizobium manausense]|uniref:alpha/beta hydrolase n=1 Tax=Bradyrhizobium manausense TaxID=989370 RepID=UPI001BA52EB0|nr:alpha/beta hydrolase [Bradyrhizobium manausense]MBR0689050.1 alpha/beta hydrolase [Bradyrhizobium manausense]MBR0722461.1 alpha/beta hydrolase [Bradyrhizobium manausense]